ncbi:aquaporin-like protein [Infundibulicybe gibba]|nr:aquaporin-like protein [Infundibulicybe gibba]
MRKRSPGPLPPIAPPEPTMCSLSCHQNPNRDTPGTYNIESTGWPLSGILGSRSLVSVPATMSDSSKTHLEHYHSAPAAPTPTPVRRNWWWKYRQMIREPAAEFAGVMILIIFGAGVDCQVVLSANTGVAASQLGTYSSINFGWAVGAALGVWVSGGISGGHINPAVTLTLATWRGFPWKKVPSYIFAQLMGGLVGAALVYANYIHAFDIVEGGRNIRTLKTAGIFSTYALDYMTAVSCFFSEFLATAVMMIVVLAMSDSRNMPPPNGLAPLVVFFLILGIGMSLGMQTSYALNPARDLGPRILTSMVGYGKAVYTFRNQYWLWCPILGPLMGAQAGAMFYDVFLFEGEESPVNKPGSGAKNSVAKGRLQAEGDIA